MECQECKVKLERDYSSEGEFRKDPQWPEGGLVLDNINVHGEGPLRFHSKGHLRGYCKANGLSSGALL